MDEIGLGRGCDLKEVSRGSCAALLHRSRVFFWLLLSVFVERQ